jgi:hypothetical protein
MPRLSALSSVQAESPVPIESRALGTLAYIRTSIESAGSMAVPGMAGIVMGAVGVLAALAASRPRWASHWLEIWLTAAGIALVLGGTLTLRQAVRPARPLYLGPARKFLVCLCPTLLAGAVLTFLLWRAEMAALLPGMWLLLYGCAVLSASTVTRPGTMWLICTMGTLFVLLGTLTFALPVRLHTLMLGLGFGGLHVLFGLLIARVNHGD